MVDTPLGAEVLDSPAIDPLAVLQSWYEEALAAGDPSPDAMTLATATADGRPSARIVLYKGLLRGGVLFVSNYRSRKGRELEQNPRAALVFYFALRERQARLEGRVERASSEESDAYFDTRPRGAQIGAWASAQSSPIAARSELEARVRELEARFAGGPVPRPPHWGGYILLPETIELWVGRLDRLHDRFIYARDACGAWRAERLCP